MDERPAVRVYSGPMLAMVVHLRQVLAMSGIEGDVRGEYRGAGLGDIPVMEAWPELWVDAPHAAEAERIVGEALADGDGAPVEAPSRPCPVCHEQVEAQFSVCWNCGATLEDV